MPLVFVFGTLKEGFPNHATNTGRRLPGDFTTQEAYPFYLVGERCSPWMLDSPGQGYPVTGQVFEVDEATLAAMDRLERISEPDGYQRKRIEVVETLSTCCHSVFVYLKPVAEFDPAIARVGPLSEYRLDHAALYRHRQEPPG